MNREPIERLRALLDIYSPRPLSRVTVLLVLGLSVLLLVRGLTTGSAAAALPLALLVWANRERFLGTVEGLLASRGWLVLAIPFSVFIAKLIMVPPAALDDLLRHIAAAFWPNGYRDMYVYAATSGAYYPSFDWGVGELAKAIGPVWTMWVVQALAWASFLAVFVTAARRGLAGHPMTDVLTLAALLLVLYLMGERLFLGRPEVFLTIWTLVAILPRGWTGVAVWAGFGMVLSSAYILAPIYFPAVLLLPLAWRGRLLVLATLTLFWGAFWLWFAGDGFASLLLRPFESLVTRIPGMQVSENVSILNLLLVPQMLGLMFVSLWAARRPGVDNRLLALAAYFMLSNQVRYGSLVAPLLALHALPAISGLAVPWPRFARGIAVALGAVTLSVASNEVPKLGALPRFEVPAGATVLSQFNEASYSTLLVNPGRIRLAPIFEFGAVDPSVQTLVLDLHRGVLDCGVARALGFTHVVERSLIGAVPPCLVLAGTQREWRLWELR